MLQDYEQVVVKDAHPKIIDEDTYNSVQSILDSKKSQVTYDTKYTYILSGMICCSSCGKKLVGSSQIGGRTKTRRYIYQCENHKARACDTKAINADYIESAVLDIVTPLANKLISQIDFNKMKKLELKEYKPLKDQIERDLKLIDRQIESYYATMSQISDSEELRKETLRRLNEAVSTKKQLNIQLTEIENKISSTDSLKRENVILTKEKLLSDRQKARTLCKLLIDKIIVNEETDELEIIIK